MVVLSAAIIKKDKTLVARGSDMFSQHPFTDAKHDQNVRIRGSVSFFDPCPIVL